MFFSTKKDKQFKFDIFYTKNFVEGINTTKSFFDAYPIIVAAGGDGTLLSVINGVSDYSHVTLLPLPIGTSNDFSRSLNIHDFRSAAEALLSNQTIMSTLGQCHFQDENHQSKTLYFCSNAGVGLFGDMAKLQTQSKVKFIFGELKNVVQALSHYLFYKNIAAEITINDKSFLSDFLFIEIFKTQYAGPARFAPFANLTNDFFDIVLCHSHSILGRLNSAYRLLCKGNHFELAEIDYFTTVHSYNKFNLCNPVKVAINTKNRAVVHANGDFIGYSPCTFEITDKKVNFFQIKNASE